VSEDDVDDQSPTGVEQPRRRRGVLGTVTRVGLLAAVCAGIPWLVPADVAASQWIRTAVYAAVAVLVVTIVDRERRSHLAALAELERHRKQVVASEQERGELTEALETRASRDVLTGLTNRDAFLEQLRRQLETEKPLAVLFLDLDDFKNVNDTLGHAVGDELITSVGARLLTSSRGHDVVARFGGDEFAVLLTDLDMGNSLRVAQRLLAELKSPFSLCGRTVAVRASGGLAISEGRAVQGIEQRALELLRQADLAMYASKSDRTHGVTLYHDAMQTDMVERLALESDMHHAIAGHDFYLDYQPIIDLRSREVTSVEALMRWQHPTRGKVPPSSFVPVAEQTGMIVPLTLWVIREACGQLRAWDADPATAGLSIAVNISGRLMHEPGIGSAIARELHHALIEPNRLVLEITESLLMEDHSYAVQTLCQLRALGTRLSVDDFGTGYSSLSRLNKLPIDEVKIDQSFVSQLEHGDAGRTIVQASVAMAHGLGLRVVAEGIETEHQLSMLRSMGCDDGQGYYFGRPSSPEKLTQLLSEWQVKNSATIASLPRQADSSASDRAITA
jgi:diguanylate cyclase (GGDEF)-like protein